jgi:hypothetical protein
MESSFSYSFRDLYQETLRYQGQNPNATGTVLDNAKRRVNDAYRKFLSQDWSWGSIVNVLQCDATKAEYELPDNFGAMRTSFKLFPYMGWINPQELPIGKLLQFLSFYPRTGIPVYFAIKTNYDPEEGVRYTAILYPTPHVSLTYSYEYKVLPNILANDNDIPYCPGDLSLVLRAFCLSEVETFDEEGAKSTWTQLLYNTLLPAAIRKDATKRPKSAGDMNNYADDLGAGNWPTIHPQFGNTLQYGSGPVTPV